MWEMFHVVVLVHGITCWAAGTESPGSSPNGTSVRPARTDTEREVRLQRARLSDPCA